MSIDEFFEEQSQQSLTKSEIVRKYFWAWAKVILPHAKKRDNKIAYIDLFAGPGTYHDGTESTPILILKHAIQEPDIREMLITLFNDANPDYAKSLKNAIDSLPGIESMRYYPKITNNEIKTDFGRIFRDVSIVPTLFFLDPWGYKGIQ